MTRRASQFVSLAVAVGLFVASPPTQGSTWIVDITGGPGSQFEEIDAAIAAASDGDTILVRPGTYRGFVIDGKGLAVIGGPGVNLVWPGGKVLQTLVVQNLGPTQNLTLRGLSTNTLKVQTCAAPVLLEEIQALNLGWNVDITDSARVTLNRCTIRGRVGIVRSEATVADCQIDGRIFLMNARTPAIHVEDSTVHVSRCTMTGEAAGAVFQRGSPALDVVSGTAIVTGDGSGSLTGGPDNSPFALPTSAIGGQGTLILDPRVVLIPFGIGPPIETSVSTTMTDVPSVAANAGAPGGNFTVDVAFPAGRAFALFVSLPGPPSTLPGFGGDLWLDPLTTAFVRGGQVPPAGRWTTTLTIPAPVAPGSVVTWQAVGQNGSSWQLSNPVDTSVDW